MDLAHLQELVVNGIVSGHGLKPCPDTKHLPERVDDALIAASALEGGCATSTPKTCSTGRLSRDGWRFGNPF